MVISRLLIDSLPLHDVHFSRPSPCPSLLTTSSSIYTSGFRQLEKEKTSICRHTRSTGGVYVTGIHLSRLQKQRHFQILTVGGFKMSWSSVVPNWSTEVVHRGAHFFFSNFFSSLIEIK